MALPPQRQNSTRHDNDLHPTRDDANESIDINQFKNI